MNYVTPPTSYSLVIGWVRLTLPEIVIFHQVPRLGPSGGRTAEVTSGGA